MRIVTAKWVKQQAQQWGADLCGIAPVERFDDAPEGFHPRNILPGCRSVIVLAVRFPASGLASDSAAAYTFIRNRLVEKIDAATFQLAAALEAAGGYAVPVPSSEPYEYWDAERRHGQGILSLKHAAVRAGLGQMGKNTLLIHETLGNMMWLGAVVCERALEADEPASYQACLPDCRLCLDHCPTQALDGTTIVQKQCRGVASRYSEGGGGFYACHRCREICPRRFGMSRSEEKA